MQFLITATLLSTAFAAPSSWQVRRQVNSTAPVTTTTTNTRLSPEYISRYHSKTGEVEFNVAGGVIQRTPSNGGDDISTLATFYIPSSWAGKKCSFGFDATLTTNFEPKPAQFQVFTSQKPAWVSSPTWPSGNLRDHHVGTMVLTEKPGKAAYVDGQPAFAKTFDCPAGYTIAGELVPVGDYVDICFQPSATEGPYIMVHDL